MILKIRNNRVPTPSWVMVSNVREVTVTEVTFSGGCRPPCDRDFLPEHGSDINFTDEHPYSFNQALVSFEGQDNDVPSSESKMYLVRIGDMFVLNEEGKTIDKF